jgi:hypothetical protein
MLLNNNNNNSLTEDYRGFPQSLEENSYALLRLGRERIVPNIFKFVSHLIIRFCINSILAMSLNR